jgi:hypothetical protein
MSNVSSTYRTSAAAPTTPTVYNLSMPLASTEYSQALDSGTKKILIRMRVRSQARFAFVSGNTSTNWITLEAGAVFFEENLDLSGVTIYLQSSTAGQTAEILAWK